MEFWTFANSILFVTFIKLKERIKFKVYLDWWVAFCIIAAVFQNSEIIDNLLIIILTIRG